MLGVNLGIGASGVDGVGRWRQVEGGRLGRTAESSDGLIDAVGKFVRGDAKKG